MIIGRTSAHDAIAAVVEAGQLAGRPHSSGATEPSARSWRWDADLESGLPFKRDTIFRIASLTKPLATAALSLLDEGGFTLDEPISGILRGPQRISALKHRSEGSPPSTRILGAGRLQVDASV